MDYKDTLLMPKTNFEMRGNLKEKDPKFILEWKKNKLYDKLSSRNAKEFVLHDGPPYANGDIHVGHALNKILKDIIVRDNVLKGKKIDWRPGWDTHGLPIELKVQQSGIKLSEVGKEKYLKSCYDYAKTQVKKQQDQFEKLALLTNFDKKYLTLDKDFEARQITVFNKMFNKGLVYQDLKPVYWSWSSQTALAEAEIEYKDAKDFSVYIKFKHQSSDVYFVIWTTTPWTIPANVAISFGKKIDYSLIECEGEKLIIASQLIDKVSETIGKKFKTIKKVDINEYINQYAINPLNNKKSKLVFGHHVTIDGGTGLVHTAGGHGQDDYIIVKENKLDLVVVMDDKGHTINSGSEFDGNFYQKTNKLIINKLTENNSLLFVDKFTHSVPIDWRTKEPVIYRATKQWFVSIDPIKKDLIKEIKNVDWFPSWGEDRLKKMTDNRSDWCISRQRLWGVPIPIIYDENKKPIKDVKLQENIVKSFEKEGIMAWHNVSIKDLLPPNIKYNDKMTKEKDILDVWFDSGTSHELLGDKQSDIYLEGSDQYRGWFNSSLITSFISKGKSPYKTVITHGFVTDKKGNKMSKSLGNVIDPLDIINKNGADILRLWVSSSDYQDTIKISDDAIKQVSNTYRKIRNTIKFILGNLYDYDNSKPELELIFKSLLNDLKKSNDSIKEKYNNYNFNKVVKEVMNQITNGPIAYLLDYSKDVLYVKKEDCIERRSIQYVLKEVLNYILYSMAPFIPVTVEEAWKIYGNKNSIFETKYPEFKSYNVRDISEFMSIKEVVNKEIEILREKKELRTSQEASVNLILTKDLMGWDKNLKNLLMVGELNIKSGDNLSSIASKFNGIKCERCWKYFKETDMLNDICKECKNVIEK